MRDVVLLPLSRAPCCRSPPSMHRTDCIVEYIGDGQCDQGESRLFFRLWAAVLHDRTLTLAEILSVTNIYLFWYFPPQLG